MVLPTADMRDDEILRLTGAGPVSARPRKAHLSVRSSATDGTARRGGSSQRRPT